MVSHLFKNNCILWNPNFRYHAHMSPLRVPSWSQMEPLHAVESYSCSSTSILSFLLCVELSRYLFPLWLLTRSLYAFDFVSYVPHDPNIMEEHLQNHALRSVMRCLSSHSSLRSRIRTHMKVVAILQ